MQLKWFSLLWIIRKVSGIKWSLIPQIARFFGNGWCTSPRVSNLSFRQPLPHTCLCWIVVLFRWICSKPFRSREGFGLSGADNFILFWIQQIPIHPEEESHNLISFTENQNKIEFRTKGGLLLIHQNRIMGQKRVLYTGILPKDDQQQNLFEDFQKTQEYIRFSHKFAYLRSVVRTRKFYTNSISSGMAVQMKKFSAGWKRKDPRLRTFEAFKHTMKNQRTFFNTRYSHVQPIRSIYRLLPILWFCIHRCQTDIFYLVISVPWSIEAFPTGDNNPHLSKIHLNIFHLCVGMDGSRHFTISIQVKQFGTNKVECGRTSIVFCTVSRHPYEFTVISNAE